MARPRRTAPAPDPLSTLGGGGDDDTNDPMADLLGGAATTAEPEEDDPLAGIGGGDAPPPTAVPGMAGLRGAVSAQTIRESVSRGGAAGPDPVVAGALADIQAKVATLSGLAAKLDAFTSTQLKLADAVSNIQKLLATLDQKLDANSATILGAIRNVTDMLEEEGEGAETWDEKAERLNLPQQIDNTGTTSKQQKQKAATAPKTVAKSPIVDAMIPFLNKKKAAEAAAGRTLTCIPLANKAAVWGAFSKQLALAQITATPDAIEKAFIDAGMVKDDAIYW